MASPPGVGLAGEGVLRFVVHALEQGDLVILSVLTGHVVPAQEQDELLGAEQVDGDLGDRRLHLGGIERGVELIGRHVEVHQPAALVLGVHQPRGQLLDVRLRGGKPALQLGDSLLGRRRLPHLRARLARLHHPQ